MRRLPAALASLILLVSCGSRPTGPHFASVSLLGAVRSEIVGDSTYFQVTHSPHFPYKWEFQVLLNLDNLPTGYSHGYDSIANGQERVRFSNLYPIRLVPAEGEDDWGAVTGWGRSRFTGGLLELWVPTHSDSVRWMFQVIGDEHGELYEYRLGVAR